MHLSRFRYVAVTLVFVLTTGLTQADQTLREDDGRRWYKGCTHFHTHWSDGDSPPEVTVAWYRDSGYHFISITDHNRLQVGERWKTIMDNPQNMRQLTPQKVNLLRERFGADWVVERETDGKREMRLKTLTELKARFEEPRRFIIIPGEEVTSQRGFQVNGIQVHVNAINIRQAIPPADGDSPVEVLRKNLDAIDEHGRRHDVSVLAHINHPNLIIPNFGSNITAEDIVEVGGERLFEVYNGHTRACNWGNRKLHIVSTDRVWDIVLTLRLSQDTSTHRPMYGVATDDAHTWYYEGARRSPPGRGWVMVLSRELTADALIAAMKKGAFYATCGVVLREIHADQSSYRVVIKAEPGVSYRTQFIGTLKGTDTSSEPVRDENGNPVHVTRRYSDAIGQVLLESTENPAVYPITGRELYVRARIVSSKLKKNPFREGDVEMAWTQPAAIR